MKGNYLCQNQSECLMETKSYRTFVSKQPPLTLIMGNEKRKVIAFDAKRLFLNNTGLGNYSRTLVRNLATFFPNNDYHLFTPRIEKNEDTAWFLDSGLFTIHVPHNRNPLWRTYFMSREINALKPDIFHGLSHELPFGLDSSIATVVTFHDLIYLLYPTQFGLWDRTIYRLKYGSAAKRATLVIAISQSTAKDLVTYYQLAEEKVKVAYQTCQNVFQVVGESATSRIASLLPQQPYFLYVGSVIPRKGLDRIVLAFATLPEYARKPVVVVGSGKGDFMEDVQRLIRLHGLQSYFHFISHVTNAELVEVYDRSYALLYPSLYEGFGIPIIESLFRSKPVITSNTSSMPEAAGPGGLLVAPLDVPMLSKAMEEIQDPALYMKLVNAGNHYVGERFNSRVTATRLMSIYQSLID